MLPLDGAPGGMYSLDMMGAELPIPSSSIIQSQFCFIPTVSSLALNDWNTKLTQNIGGASNPFNSVYIQNLNELHTRFNSPASFLYSKLTNASVSATIIGDNTVCNPGSTFTLNNPPAGTVSWSVTGPFSVSSANGARAVITKTEAHVADGTLTAMVNGTPVATKTINSCTGSIIMGPDEVCYEGSTFILNNPPQGATLQWLVSGPLHVVSSYGDRAVIARTGTGNGVGTINVYYAPHDPFYKVVTACPAPVINGPGTVCYSGSAFTLTNPPANFTWTVSEPFSFSPTSTVTSTTAASPAVYRIVGATGSGGSLSVRFSNRVNGTEVVSIPLAACLSAISGPVEVCYNGGSFSLTNPPPGTVYWTVSNRCL
jgi:hypothetical protein